MKKFLVMAGFALFFVLGIGITVLVFTVNSSISQQSLQTVTSQTFETTENEPVVIEEENKLMAWFRESIKSGVEWTNRKVMNVVERNHYEEKYALASKIVSLEETESLADFITVEMKFLITQGMLLDGITIEDEIEEAMFHIFIDQSSDVVMNVLNFESFSDVIAKAMVEVYTLEELQLCVNFYESPIGKQIASKESQLFDFMQKSIDDNSDILSLKVSEGLATFSKAIEQKRIEETSSIDLNDTSEYKSEI